jgi:protein-L-isoaspartate(D-aspartate) O-methyltransferase
MINADKGKMKQILKIICLSLMVCLVACRRASDSEEGKEAAVVPTVIVSPTQPQSSSAEITVQKTPTPVAEDPYIAQREEMVQSGIIDWGIEDAIVIRAMRTVPRHEFVPEEFVSQAYANHPLPIGYGQTISQPYIVALMTQAAEVEATDIVLEVGTGSSYQAAVLADLVAHVYTIEIIEAMVESAETTLDRLGYDNVTVRHADGYFGWEEQGPFDAILVTAAPDHVPQPLVKQLKIGGRMIIPVGPVGGFQTLWRITRISEEEVRTENLGGVRFVPLTREER